MQPNDDIEVLKKAKPYLRSILAFVIYIRWPADKQFCYREADEFIKKLEQEVEADAQ